ncbi:hypothetical protein TKK_0013527 [Trichogramma kaykai]|uniref:Uncharacterized protein n=1 Tax=Trichogramma kaykai TaxID=54128 RepID=A0ABD2WI35_9HYME
MRHLPRLCSISTSRNRPRLCTNTHLFHPRLSTTIAIWSLLDVDDNLLCTAMEEFENQQPKSTTEKETINISKEISNIINEILDRIITTTDIFNTPDDINENKGPHMQNEEIPKTINEILDRIITTTGISNSQEEIYENKGPNTPNEDLIPNIEDSTRFENTTFETMTTDDNN